MTFRPLHPKQELSCLTSIFFDVSAAVSKELRLIQLAPDLRLDGVLCSRKHIACGRRTRHVLCTRDSEVHPSRVNALIHFFGRPSVALRDAELLERFRPPCTWDCEGFYVECQDFTQLSGHFIRAYHRTQFDDAMP